MSEKVYLVLFHSEYNSGRDHQYISKSLDGAIDWCWWSLKSGEFYECEEMEYLYDFFEINDEKELEEHIKKTLREEHYIDVSDEGQSIEIKEMELND